MYTFILALAILPAVQDQAPDADGATAHRPAWIELSKRNKLPRHAEAVASELWASRDEAQYDVLEKAATRALAFAAEAVPRVRSKWEVPTWVVRDRLLSEPIFVEEVDWTYGTMYRAYALMELSPEKRDLLLTEWHQIVLRERLTQIGGGLAFVFICLLTLFGYLRLDESTRGYYSRWLFTGATALVAGSAAVLYNWIV